MEVDRGEIALRKLERDVMKITNSKKKFAQKLEMIAEELKDSMIPFDRKGEDHVLGEMRIFAGQAAETAASDETEAIICSSNTYDQKNKMLDDIVDAVDSNKWIAEGFRTAVRMDVIFRKAEMRSTHK
ncbi:MAG: hypothetical protein AABW59_03305 [archaeon]